MLIKAVRRFLKDEEGPTAVEYAVMVAGIALLIIAGVWALGGKVGKTFEEVANHIPKSGSGQTGGSGSAQQ